MLLSQIAEQLRSTMTEQEIVQAIKDRKIEAIEEHGYTTQQNYPNGVYVYAQGEDLDGILFGEKS